MGTLGTLAVSIVGDAKDLEKTFDGVGKNMQNLGKSIGNTGKTMTKFVTGPIVALGVGLGKAAMDLEATEAKYNTVFEGMTDVSDQFIKDFQKLTPATTAEARSMASGIQDLLIPMGFMREDATELTSEFMHVTGALANFNSGTHTAEDVSSAMQSAILGQYQSLAALGIQLNATTVEQKALEMGLMEAGDEMTNQIRTQVVLAEVYNQSGDALEAYTEDNLDAKTKMGLLRAEIVDIAAEIGTNLLPVIHTITDFIRTLTERFANLTEGQQKTILVIMGVVAALGPVLMIVGKVIAIIGTILPILKVVGAAILFLTSPIGIIIAVVAGLAFLIVKYWDEIKEFTINAFNAIRDFLAGLWDKIKEIFVAAWEFIKDVFFKYHPLGWIIDNWNEIKDFFANIWESIKDIFSGATSGLFDGIKERFTAVKDWLSDIWEKIKDFFINIWESISGVFDMSLGDIWETIKGWFWAYQDFVKDIMGNIEGTISDLWNSAKDKVLQAAKAIYDGVKNWFTNLAGSVRGVIRGMVNAVIGLFNNMIGRLNRLSIKIPDWVPGWGGREFSPNIPTIPTLHKGTDFFIPPGGGREGLALLERGEQVIPRGEGRTVTHTGTIRVEGVNNAGELVAVKDILIEELYKEIRG